MYKLLFCILASILFSLGSCKPTANTTTNTFPNIIWIVSEDNSPLLGCYGDKNASTPNIDKLAEEGILYNNAFANAPVCAPSRSTLITGMYPTSLGSQHMRSLVSVPNEVKFFPNYLKESGYYTTLRVKRDYNIPPQAGTWDEDRFWEMKGAFKNKNEGQPFFMFYNTWMSHESKIHDRNDLPDYFEATFKNSENYDSLYHTFPDFDSIKFDIPSYMPDSPEAQSDWAWYYKAMSMMDYEVGSILSYLKKEKLIENTIIIYSSDHGGVLGRSKRFDYESGLRVPMIILFPPKYQHLAPKPNGSATDQLVSFVDMAPSILSLANIKKPKHMHGNAFMGIHKQAEEKEVFGFRGRMDEAYDMVRTVRNKKYRYIRNYMPHRPNGQHIEFLWKSKSLSKWSENYKNGNCTEEQKVFYEPRVTEELYDISTDPENINNLALNADFKKHLEKFRKINTKNCIDHLDAGFFAEGDLWQRAKGNNTTIKEVVEKNQDECLKAIEAAELATMSPNVTNLKSMLHSDYSAVRFWGATGCVLLGDKAKPLIKILKELAIESVDDISVTCAESLYLLDEKTWAFEVLINALKSDNIYVQLRALNVISNQNINDKKILQEIEILDKENEYIAKLSRYIIQKNRASQ